MDISHFACFFSSHQVFSASILGVRSTVTLQTHCLLRKYEINLVLDGILMYPTVREIYNQPHVVNSAPGRIADELQTGVMLNQALLNFGLAFLRQRSSGQEKRIAGFVLKETIQETSMFGW